MNRVIKNIGYLFLCMIVTLQSCSDVLVEPAPTGEGDALVPIALDLGGLIRTYGTDYGNVIDTVGSDSENAVNDIIVYIFDNTFSCEKILVGSTSPVGPELVKVGTKHFIAVVNAQTNVPSLYPVPTANPSSISYSILRQTLSAAKISLPASPFLMVGERLNVGVTEQRPETDPYRIKIDVERAVAKVTMSFTKSDKALAHNITLQKVTLFKGANKVYLLNRPATDDIAYTLTETKTNFALSGVVLNTPTYIALLDSFYTYASDAGKDTTKAVRFEIEAMINSPTNVRTAKFFLASYFNGSDTVYDIRRNYWYDVKVNIKNPGMDSIYVNVTACPWNLAEAQEDTIGEGAVITTALPFKLVKNYTAANLTAYPTIGAIDDHSKGASWIDLKVTKNTPWSLVLINPMADRNQGVIASKNGGVNWQAWDVSNPVTGTGNDQIQRVYIYRPYVEDNEPPLGPAFYVAIRNQAKESFFIQGRDTVPLPVNSYVLRPALSGAPLNQTTAYIPLAGVFSHWENEIYSHNIRLTAFPITASVLWKDHPTQDVVKNVRVVHPNSPDSAYIIAEAGVPGNAVIAMHLQTVNPTIHWTFHIWVTEYDPYQAAGQKLYTPSSTVKNVFMDRNLGALTNTYDVDGKARGLFYQFGRKDPFPTTPLEWFENNSSATLHPFTTKSVSTVPVNTDLRNNKLALQYVLTYPDQFIIRSVPAVTEDWPLVIENDNLWHTPEGKKTAYDPCPEGWRVPLMKSNTLPSLSPWSGEIINTGPNGFNFSISNGIYSPLVGYYPYSGYMSAWGVLEFPGSNSRYWTSYSGASNVGYGLTVTHLPILTISSWSSIDKFLGANVRCVVDKDYIKKAENGGLFGTGVINLKNNLLP